MKQGKKFTELTTNAQKEIMLNPVYARLMKDQRNAKTLLFVRDEKNGGFYILNYLSAFTI